MPILKPEDDLYPPDLLDFTPPVNGDVLHWYCLYTLSRREKDLMRRLKALGIGYYGPVIAKRSRSPQGRLRVAQIPLFPNYVFMCGSPEDRSRALSTNCISRYAEVPDGEGLVHDLRQIRTAISSGTPLTPEARLSAGQAVRVRSGPFRGYEGIVLRREGKTRLLLAVRYLEQGVSMEMDEGLLSPL